MNQPPYCFDYTPTYSNDAEYKDALRNLFRMKISTEEDYDEESVAKGLDFIYKLTEPIPIFQELYVLAAGKMISEDPQFGLALLFAYDYLIDFQLILMSYFSKENIDAQVETLKQKLA